MIFLMGTLCAVSIWDAAISQMDLIDESTDTLQATMDRHFQYFLMIFFVGFHIFYFGWIQISVSLWAFLCFAHYSLKKFIIFV